MSHALEDEWHEIGKSKKSKTTGCRATGTVMGSHPEPIALFCKMKKQPKSVSNVFNIITQSDPQNRLVGRPSVLEVGKKSNKTLHVESFGPDVFLVNFAERGPADKFMQMNGRASWQFTSSWWSEKIDDILKTVSKKVWFFSLWLGSGANNEPLDKQEISEIFSAYGELYHHDQRSTIVIYNDTSQPFAFVSFRSFARLQACLTDKSLAARWPRPLRMVEFATILSTVLEILRDPTLSTTWAVDDLKKAVQVRCPQVFLAFENKFTSQFKGLLTLTSSLPHASPFALFLRLSYYHDQTMFDLASTNASSGLTIQAHRLEPSFGQAKGERFVQTMTRREHAPTACGIPPQSGTQPPRREVPPGEYKADPLELVAEGYSSSLADGQWKQNLHNLLARYATDIEAQLRILESTSSQLTFQNPRVWCLALDGTAGLKPETVLTCGDLVRASFLDYTFVGVIQNVSQEYLTIFMPHELEFFARSQQHDPASCHLVLDCMAVTFHLGVTRGRVQRLREAIDRLDSSNGEMESPRVDLLQQQQLVQMKERNAEVEVELRYVWATLSDKDRELNANHQELARLRVCLQVEQDKNKRQMEVSAFVQEWCQNKTTQVFEQEQTIESLKAENESLKSRLEALQDSERKENLDLPSSLPSQGSSASDRSDLIQNGVSPSSDPLPRLQNSTTSGAVEPRSRERTRQESRSDEAALPQAGSYRARGAAERNSDDAPNAGDETPTTGEQGCNVKSIDEAEDFPMLGSPAAMASHKKKKDRREAQSLRSQAAQAFADNPVREGKPRREGKVFAGDRLCLQCGSASPAQNQAFCNVCEESGVFFLKGVLRQTPKGSWEVSDAVCAHCAAEDGAQLCTCEHVQRFSGDHDSSFQCDSRPPRLSTGDQVSFIPARSFRLASLIHEYQSPYESCRVLSVVDLCNFTDSNEALAQHSSDACGTVFCPSLQESALLSQVWDKTVCFDYEWVSSYIAGMFSIVVGSSVDIPRMKVVRRPRVENSSKWVLMACKPKCLLRGQVQVLPQLAVVLGDSKKSESKKSFWGQRIMPNCRFWQNSSSYLRTSFELLWTETFFPMCVLLQGHSKGRADLQWGKAHKHAKFHQLILHRSSVGLRFHFLTKFNSSSGSFKCSNLIAVMLHPPKSESRSQNRLFWATADGEDRMLRLGVVDIYLVKNSEAGGVQNAGVETLMEVLELIVKGYSVTLFESEAFFEAHRYSLSKLASLVNAELNGGACLSGQDELVRSPWPEQDGDGDLSNRNNRSVQQSSQLGRYENELGLQTALRHRLNPAQELAFQYATDTHTDEVFRLIVGPPGTGKSHVGTVLLDSLCDESKNTPPILVVSNNNVAVDSCLGALVHIPSNNLQPGKDVFRIGGQTSLPPEYKVLGVMLNKTEIISGNLSLAVADDGDSDESFSDHLELVCNELHSKVLAKRNFEIGIMLKGDSSVSLTTIEVLEVTTDTVIPLAAPELPLSLSVDHSEDAAVTCCFSTDKKDALIKIEFHLTNGEDDCVAPSDIIRGSFRLRLDDKVVTEFKHIKPDNAPDFLFVSRSSGNGKRSAGSQGDGRAKYRREENVDDADESDVRELAEAHKIVKIFRKAAEKHQFKAELDALLRRAGKEAERLDDKMVQALKKRRVIGATVTGATKNAHILAQLGIKVVIVEEAAQTIEGDLIACLPPDVEKVIMLGDHRQTQPNLSNSIWKKHLCTNTAAESSGTKSAFARFDLSLDRIRPNLSLFERLIRCRHSHVSLTVQYRMPSVLADLIRQDDPQWPLYQGALYTDGTVSQNLQERRAVFARRCKVFSSSQKQPSLHFINHSLQETQEMHNGCPRGFHNPGEAGMLVGVVEWLLRQGIDARSITVLAMYKAQVTYIEGRLRERCVQRTFDDFRNRMIEDDTTTALQKVKVFTVDGFQGSENDIILLSLTRSNAQGQQGWVQDYRRIGVSLSRAKVAQFVFGNFQCLSKSHRHQQAAFAYSAGEIWEMIAQKAEARSGYAQSSRVRIQCQNHDEASTIDLSSLSKDGLLPLDLAEFAPDGGCPRFDDSTPVLGRMCGYSDQDSDFDTEAGSEDQYSESDCETSRIRFGVVDGRCKQCDADMQLFCHPGAQDSVSCLRRCTKVLECKHRCIRQCRDKDCEVMCLHPVLVTLACGHTQTVPCCIRSRVRTCAQLRDELRKLRAKMQDDSETEASTKSATDTLSQALPGISSSFAISSFYNRQECSKCGGSVLMECGQNPAHLICVREEMPRFLEFMDLHVLPSEGSYAVVKPNLATMQSGRVEVSCCVLRSSLQTVFAALYRMRLECGNGVFVAEVHLETPPAKSAQTAYDEDNTAVHVDLGVESSFAAEKGGLDGVLDKLTGFGCTVERKETSMARRLGQLSGRKQQQSGAYIRREFLEVLRNSGVDCDFRAFTPPEFKNWKGTGPRLPATVQISWTDRTTGMSRPKEIAMPQPNLAIELVADGVTTRLGFAHSEIILAACDFFSMVLEEGVYGSLDHAALMKVARSSKKNTSKAPRPAPENSGPRDDDVAGAQDDESACLKLQFNSAVVMPGTVCALVSYFYSPHTFRGSVCADPPPARELLQLLRMSFFLGLLYLHQICESLIYQLFSDDLNVMSQVSECFGSSTGVSDPLRECQRFFPASVCAKLEGCLSSSRKTLPDAIEPLSLLKLPQGLRDTMFAPKLLSQCLFLSQTTHRQYRLLHQELSDRFERFVFEASRYIVLQEVQPAHLEWTCGTWKTCLRTLKFKVSNLQDEEKAMRAVLAVSGPPSTKRCATFHTKRVSDGVLGLEITEEDVGDAAWLAESIGAEVIDVRLQYLGEFITGQKRVRLRSSTSRYIADISPRAATPGGRIVVSVRGAAESKPSPTHLLLRQRIRQDGAQGGEASRSGVYTAASGTNEQPRPAALECLLETALVESSEPGIVPYSVQIPDTAKEGEYVLSVLPEARENGLDSGPDVAESANLTILPGLDAEAALASITQCQDPELPSYRPEDVSSYLLHVFRMCHVTEAAAKHKWFRVLCPDQSDDFDLTNCHVFTSALGKASGSLALGPDPDVLQSCLMVLHADEQDEIVCCVGAHHLSAISSESQVRSRFIVPAETETASASPHVIMIWDYFRRNPARDHRDKAHASLDDLCRFISKYISDSGAVDLQQLSLCLNATAAVESEPSAPEPKPAQASRSARDDEDLGDLRAAESTDTSRADPIGGSIAVSAEKGWDVQTFTDLKAVRRKGRHHCRLFKACDTVSGSLVAIKVLKADHTRKHGGPAERTAAQLQREWEALHFFSNHPCDYVMHGIARLEAWHCLVLPWYEGETLHSVICSSDGPTALTFVRTLLDVAHGLDHMHGLGWTHGSVCPGNVLLTTDLRVKLTGLGLASPSPVSLAKAINREHLSFAAPECFERERPCTALSDAYSLGAIVLFWLKAVTHSQYAEPGVQAHIHAVTAFALASHQRESSLGSQQACAALLEEVKKERRAAFSRWEHSYRDAGSPGNGDRSMPKGSSELKKLLFVVTTGLVYQDIEAGSGLARLADGAVGVLRDCAKRMAASEREEVQVLSQSCLEVQPSQRLAVAQIRHTLCSVLLRLQA